MSEKDQSRLPLIEALDGFIASEPAYFNIPGHRFENGVSDELACRFGQTVFCYDLTEAAGLDDLHRASGAIKEAEELAAGLYGADRTWFLVNGSTCGNEAMIMAVCRPGDEIIVPRNAHSSVFSGLVLSGAYPVWMQPEFDSEWGISTVVTPEIVEDTIKAHPNAKAVFITSPTYYGNASPLYEIAGICHKYGMPLLVDEAHGAHFYFSDSYPEGAIAAGADMCVMSTHKTCGSMTQSSLLHFRAAREKHDAFDPATGEPIVIEKKVPRVDAAKVDRALSHLMSTSPSYVLMASLDAARAQLASNGAAIGKEAAELALGLRRGLAEIPGIEIYGGTTMICIKSAGLDPTRVVFSAKRLGIGGHELADRLFEEAGVSLEMSDEENVVAIVTGGNQHKDILQLIMGVTKIAMNAGGRMDNSKERYSSFFISPEVRMSPREAFFAEGERIEIENSAGRIALESVAPYPPGIPFVNPGELITEKVVSALKLCRDEKIPVHGPASGDVSDILVMK